MKKIISIILVASFSFMTVACAGVKVPVKTASDLRNVKPNDQYMRSYRVTFVTGQKYVLDDEDVIVQGNTLGLRLKDDEEFRYYTPDQIAEVKRHIKRRTGTGALIGLGAGGAGGALIGMGLNPPWKSCENARDPGDCRTYKTAFPLLGGIFGALVGAGVGAGIGAATKRKKKGNVTMTVTPQVYGGKGVKINGGGLGIRGSF